MKTFVAVFLALCVSPASLRGEVVIYDVNLLETAQNDHQFRVTGTISYDRTADSLIGSALVFIHESDPPVSFSSLPNFSSPPGGGLWHWEATSNELRFVRDSFESASVHWSGGLYNEGFGIQGSGDEAFGEFRINHDDGQGNVTTEFTTQNHFFPAPGQFVLGRVVPEPSSIALAGISGLAGLVYRWHRRRR